MNAIVVRKWKMYTNCLSETVRRKCHLKDFSGVLQNTGQVTVISRFK
jgi:hypothetical protein